MISKTLTEASCGIEPENYPRSATNVHIWTMFPVLELSLYKFKILWSNNRPLAPQIQSFRWQEQCISQNNIRVNKICTSFHWKCCFVSYHYIQVQINNTVWEVIKFGLCLLHNNPTRVMGFSLERCQSRSEENEFVQGVWFFVSLSLRLKSEV